MSNMWDVIFKEGARLWKQKLFEKDFVLWLSGVWVSGVVAADGRLSGVAEVCSGGEEGAKDSEDAAPYSYHAPPGFSARCGSPHLRTDQCPLLYWPDMLYVLESLLFQAKIISSLFEIQQWLCHQHHEKIIWYTYSHKWKHSPLGRSISVFLWSLLS